MAEAKPSASAPLPPAWWRRGVFLAYRTARPFLLAFLAVVLLAMLFEERLIYFPSPYNEADAEWRPVGLTFEDAWFEASDGVKLHGWYCPVEKPRAVVLYCHGNAGHLAWRAPVMERLQRLGVTAMIFDYRGYGRSAGRPNEVGILQDARAARRWLSEKTGVAEDEIVLMGRSLGGAVAIDLAARDGAGGLIVESSFTSLPDVGAVHYWYLPVRLLARTQFRSVDLIGQVRCPVLISHGTADEVVPYALGEALFAAAAEPKQFYSVEGGLHNVPQPTGYYEALDRFFERLPELSQDASADQLAPETP